MDMTSAEARAAAAKELALQVRLAAQLLVSVYEFGAICSLPFIRGSCCATAAGMPSVHAGHSCAPAHVLYRTTAHARDF